MKIRKLLPGEFRKTSCFLLRVFDGPIPVQVWTYSCRLASFRVLEYVQQLFAILDLGHGERLNDGKRRLLLVQVRAQ